MAKQDKTLFSPKELEQVAEAVRETESASSLEIVPVFVRKAGEYPEVFWKMGVLGLLSSILILLVADLTADFGLFYTSADWFLLAVLGAIPFVLLSFWPAWSRFLVGMAELHAQSLEQASLAFLNNGVFETSERSGLLLYISFYERQIHILPDVGITDMIDRDELLAIRDNLIKGMRSGQQVEAICAAIQACGALIPAGALSALDEAGDELSNDLQTPS